MIILRILLGWRSPVHTTKNIFIIFLLLLLIGCKEDKADSSLFPNVVALQIEIKGSSDVEECSAVVLSNKHILTAAHCFNEDDDADVSVATGNKKDKFTKLKVSKISFHPDHDFKTHANDLAIVHLKKPKEFFDSYPEILDHDDVIIDSQAFVIGYGMIKSGDSNRKKKEMISIVKKVTTNRIHLVGVNKEVDVCHGDSGGGVFYEVDSKLILVGISVGLLIDSTVKSKEEDVCGKGLTSIHEYLVNFKEWIVDEMN
jgi:secreted trypsin-like serine protease